MPEERPPEAPPGPGFWQYQDALGRRWRADSLATARKHLLPEIGLSIAVVVVSILQKWEESRWDSVIPSMGWGLLTLVIYLLVVGLWHFTKTPRNEWEAQRKALEASAAEIAALKAQLAEEGPLRFEVVLGEDTYAHPIRCYDEVTLLGDNAERVERTCLHVRLTLQFQNHDATPTTVDGLSLELWLSEAEKAEELELLEWNLASSSFYGADSPHNIAIPVPGRKKTGYYALVLAKKYAGDVLAKAKSETAFLRLTARSLGNPNWSLDVPLRRLDQ